MRINTVQKVVQNFLHRKLCLYHIRFIYLKIFLHQAPQIILSLSKFLWWEVGWHMCRRKAYLAQPSLVGGGVRESQGFSKDGG